MDDRKIRPSKGQEVLRWLAVPIATAVGGVLILFPMHWIIFMGCRSEDSMVRLSDESRAVIERYLTGFCFPVGCLFCGAWMAPKYRMNVAFCIAGILLACVFIVRLWVDALKNYTGHWEIMPMLLNLAGIGAGIFAAKAYDDRQNP